MRAAHKKTGRKPVCRLLRRLYGHPSAGLFWERRYKNFLQEAGFKEMLGWQCLFYREQYTVILSVYVAEFKMAGKHSGLATAW